jgi:hypothetical protein
VDWRKTHLMWRKSRPRAEPANVLLLPVPTPPPAPMDFAKTQVLPIEQVAQVLRTHRVEPRPAKFDGARTQKISLAALRRVRRPRLRATWLLLCVSALIVASAHATLSTNSARSTRRSPPSPPPIAARPPPATAPAAPAAPAAPPSAPRPNPAPGAPAVTQRKIVDALASGDTARAAELYADLATRDPGRREWAVAARVLAARAKPVGK